MHLQAIDLDPTDATLLSNRSLCWIRLDQAEHALDDAKACRALRPDWPKLAIGKVQPYVYYRHAFVFPSGPQHLKQQL